MSNSEDLCRLLDRLKGLDESIASCTKTIKQAKKVRREVKKHIRRLEKNQYYG